MDISKIEDNSPVFMMDLHHSNMQFTSCTVLSYTSSSVALSHNVYCALFLFFSTLCVMSRNWFWWSFNHRTLKTLILPSARLLFRSEMYWTVFSTSSATSEVRQLFQLGSPGKKFKGPFKLSTFLPLFLCSFPKSQSDCFPGYKWIHTHAMFSVKHLLAKFRELILLYSDYHCCK